MPISIDPANRALADGFMDGLEDLLDSLVNAPAFAIDDEESPPETPGVYLFTAGDDVLHVGRTRKLKSRRGQQCSLTGTHNSASAAFKLARSNALEDGVALPRTRQATQEHPDFLSYFDAARQQFRAAEFRFVEIDDPPIQTVFEIYASIALRLPRELWLTH